MAAVPLLPRYEALVADVIESTVEPETEIGYTVWFEMVSVECAECESGNEDDCQGVDRMAVIYTLVTLDCCAEHRMTQVVLAPLGGIIDNEQALVEMISQAVSDLTFRQIAQHSGVEAEGVSGAGEG